MRNFIISNQSQCFIPATATTIPNIRKSDFRRIDIRRLSRTFGESDIRTFGDVRTPGNNGRVESLVSFTLEEGGWCPR